MVINLNQEKEKGYYFQKIKTKSSFLKFYMVVPGPKCYGVSVSVCACLHAWGRGIRCIQVHMGDCLFVGVGVCTSKYVCVCVYAFKWRLKVDVRCLSGPLSSLFLRQDLSLNLELPVFTS